MVEEKVVRYTRSGNPVDAPKGTVHHIRRDSVANMTRWKETLTEEEIARVYEITQPISSSYYQNKDWEIFAQPSIIASSKEIVSRENCPELWGPELVCKVLYSRTQVIRYKLANTNGLNCVLASYSGVASRRHASSV